MPVQKFRSFEDAERALWLEPGDPRIWQGLWRRWELHLLLGAPTPEPQAGVYRYRNLTDKQAASGVPPS